LKLSEIDRERFQKVKVHVLPPAVLKAYGETPDLVFAKVVHVHGRSCGKPPESSHHIYPRVRSKFWGHVTSGPMGARATTHGGSVDTAGSGAEIDTLF
jgi:hypothetical protein